MKIIENNSGIDSDSIIKIVGRRNNNKRKYLLLNPYQAKHMPVKPNDVLTLFNRLGNMLKGHYENALFIGFSETATAIGAAVCGAFSDKAYYIHTTREEIGINTVHFSEEHSHAAEHLLFNSEELKKANRIVFVDDEFSTGKTILNLIDKLRLINPKAEYCAVSIINAMNDENYNNFLSMGIDLIHLIRLELSENDKEVSFPYKANILAASKTLPVEVTDISGRLNPRYGLYYGEYMAAINKLSQSTLKVCGDIPSDARVLVLGTEEFMYPAVITAAYIADACKAAVYTYATTRSPILAFDREDYPIKVCNEIISPYDKNRKTFIYNAYYYDYIIVMTDSEVGWKDGLGAIKAVFDEKCRNIFFIRWTDN